MGSHRAARGLKAYLAKSSAAVRDVRSVRLVEQLQAKWRDKIRLLPPAERETWLRSAEAIVGLGAKRSNQLRKELIALRASSMTAVPSGEWLDAIWNHGRILPAMIVAHQTDGRPHAVRMKLSREQVRIGLDGKSSRRWTPPQAVEVEDFLDGMERIRAEFYSYPPSPSALAIFKVNTYGGAERGRFPGKRRGRRGQWFGGGY